MIMRPRALIDTLEPEPQPASLFLSRLPPEIRSHIYDHVFGYRHLHIFIYEQKLVCLVCQNPTAVDPDDHEECIGMSMSRSKIPWSDDGIKRRAPSAPDKKRQHLSALLAVCRTMYLETVESLYRTHTFHFSNIVSLTVFPREIIPRHRALLHHLRIDLLLLGNASGTSHDELYIFLHNSLSQKWTDWDEASSSDAGGGGDTPWECAWGAVAELTSLHTLVVTIEISTPSTGSSNLDMAAGLEKWLFEPLAKVTCNDFLLRVNWSAPPMTPDIDQAEPEYPFRVERFTSKST
ncbi:hypothetical protein PG984_014012 [Apiospora sp. TS-2023a]